MNATALNHNAVIGVDAWGLADETDRRFRKTAAITLLVFVVLAIVIPLLKLAGLERGGGDTLDRRGNRRQDRRAEAVRRQLAESRRAEATGIAEAGTGQAQGRESTADAETRRADTRAAGRSGA
jgi:uncharacterized membrane protein